MKIAVIGGGTAGLAAAYDLAGGGHEVTVFEAREEVGGLASGFRDPTWEWSLEKFYHHWFATDDEILGLISEIGHAAKIRFYNPCTSLWHQDGIFPVDAPTTGSATLSRVSNVLRLPELSLLAKLRLGLVGALLKLYPWGITLERHTADAWLLRWVGKAAHELVWRPLLIGKFGALYDRVNMAWFWARLHKRTARLGTYVGGFQAMLEDLASAVHGRGARILLSTPVRQVVPSPEGGLLVTTNRSSRERFDQVLCTASPTALLEMVPDLGAPYGEKVRALKCLGAVALILALDRQVMTDGTYWLNLPANTPSKEDNPFPFLAMVEHTNYVSPKYFGGEHLLYLGDYLPADHEYFKLSEGKLADRFLPFLKRVNPEFSPAWIRKRWLFRVPYAQPVPFVNHSKNIPDVRTPIEGLYFASMSQVYPWDRGMNYAVEIGRRAARMMQEDMAF